MRTKLVPPETDSFVANINAAFVQNVFDLPQAKWISHIIQDSKFYNFRAGFEIFEDVMFFHCEIISQY